MRRRSAAPAIDGATDGRSGPAIGDVAAGWAAVLWLVGRGALAVPTVAALTATVRSSPLVVAGSVVAAVAGAGADAAVALAVAAVVPTADRRSRRGRASAFVQASAYGDEHRYPLRPPLGYLLAGRSCRGWLWSAGAVVGPLLLAARRGSLGGVAHVAGVPLPRGCWPRCHQLTPVARARAGRAWSCTTTSCSPRR